MDFVWSAEAFVSVLWSSNRLYLSKHVFGSDRILDCTNMLMRSNDCWENAALNPYRIMDYLQKTSHLWNETWSSLPLCWCSDCMPHQRGLQVDVLTLITFFTFLHVQRFRHPWSNFTLIIFTIQHVGCLWKSCTRWVLFIEVIQKSPAIVNHI